MNKQRNKREFNGSEHPGGIARLAVVARTDDNRHSLASNLAITLARRGRDVCLITINSPVFSGQNPESPLEQRLTERRLLSEILLDGSAGIRILPAGSTFSNFFQLDDLRQQLLTDLLADMEAAFDYLIVEAPPTVDEGILHLYQAAPLIVLSVTPEADALTGAFELLKTLKRRNLNPQIHVAVETDGGLLKAQESFKKLHRTASKYLQIEPDYLGFFSSQERLQEQHGEDLTDTSVPFDRHLGAITDRIERMAEKAIPPIGLSTLYNKLRGIQTTTTGKRETVSDSPTEQTQDKAAVEEEEALLLESSSSAEESEIGALRTAIYFASILARIESGQSGIVRPA